MILWLIGMMGSGKTSAGILAASNLGIPFSDTDNFVAGRMGCSVAQLWGDLGESAFRDMEKVAVMNLAETEGIISTGGGVVLDRDNRRLLSRSPKVVWLVASPVTLAHRLAGTGDRPGLVADNRSALEYLTELLEQRRGFYEEVATHRVETESVLPDDVATHIEAIWRE